MGQSMQYIVSFADIIKRGNYPDKTDTLKRDHSEKSETIKKKYPNISNTLKKSKQDQVLQEENGRKRQKMNVFERFRGCFSLF